MDLDTAESVPCLLYSSSATPLNPPRSSGHPNRESTWPCCLLLDGVHGLNFGSVVAGDLQEELVGDLRISV